MSCDAPLTRPMLMIKVFGIQEYSFSVQTFENMFLKGDLLLILLYSKREMNKTNLTIRHTEFNAIEINIKIKTKN